MFIKHPACFVPETDYFISKWSVVLRKFEKAVRNFITCSKKVVILAFLGGLCWFLTVNRGGWCRPEGHRLSPFIVSRGHEPEAGGQGENRLYRKTRPSESFSQRYLTTSKFLLAHSRFSIRNMSNIILKNSARIEGQKWAKHSVSYRSNLSERLQKKPVSLKLISCITKNIV